MKRLLSLSFIAGLILSGGGCACREVSVKDLTQSETIILRKKPSQGAIVGLSIAGRGSIAGKAEVQLILNGAIYRQEILSGRVGFKWNGDWYAGQAEVRYLAGTASAGALALQYEFSDR